MCSGPWGRCDCHSYVIRQTDENVDPIVVFLVIFGLYKYSTHTPEQVGAHNQLVWWNISRLIHTIMLIIFVYLVVYEKFNYAKMIPFLDISIGIAAVSYHYSSYK